MAIQQGMNQMTPAQQLTIRGGSSASGTRKRRSKTRTKKRARATSTKKKAGSSRGKLKRLVKGSKEAKAYMAKIRRKRK
jgi:hypothetical protein